MKKLLAVLLIVFVATSFVACSEKDGETIKITFAPNMPGVTMEGNSEVEITSGTALSSAQMPSVSSLGFDFLGWAYDEQGTRMWNEGDIFSGNTVLYAVWNDTHDEMININFFSGGMDTALVRMRKGSKLDATLLPEFYRDGYTFKYWAYDTQGENEWNGDDIFVSDTTLYAIWSAVGGSGNDGVGTDFVVVEFNTGTGYFSDINLYEAAVKKGGRLNSLPTPLHSNSAMVFNGWYKDSACTIPVSLSDKYNGNTVLYAGWTMRTQCMDGSYNHSYSAWDIDQKAGCTRDGTYARYCTFCNDKQTKTGDPALGHLYAPWEEAFMSKQRKCQRLGCGEIEIKNFENLTVSVLGETPVRQIEGSNDRFYAAAPFTNLINNRWDEGYGEHVSPKGNGTAHIQFNFIEPTAIDRVYFKATGSVSVNIYVKYEDSEEWALLGICGSSVDKDSAPYVEADNTRKVVSVKIVEESPQNGMSIWQEVAFVKVAE